MMKRFLVIGLLTGLVTMGRAQTGVSNDPAAKKILDGVSAKFKTYKAVQLLFTLKVKMVKENCRVARKVPCI